MRRTQDEGAMSDVDRDRLERSLGLQVQYAGRGRYRVSGGERPHWVDLHTGEQPRCDCGDYQWREQICKHILAACLREGDEQVISGLADLVQEFRRQLGEAREG